MVAAHIELARAELEEITGGGLNRVAALVGLPSAACIFAISSSRRSRPLPRGVAVRLDRLGRPPGHRAARRHRGDRVLDRARRAVGASVRGPARCPRSSGWSSPVIARPLPFTTRCGSQIGVRSHRGVESGVRPLVVGARRGVALVGDRRRPRRRAGRRGVRRTVIGSAIACFILGGLVGARWAFSAITFGAGPGVALGIAVAARTWTALVRPGGQAGRSTPRSSGLAVLPEPDHRHRRRRPSSGCANGRRSGRSPSGARRPGTGDRADGPATREAVDIPAKIRRAPGKSAAVAGSAAFLLVGGPRRVLGRVRRAVFGKPTALPDSMLPDEIERPLRELGPDGDPGPRTPRARIRRYLDDRGQARRAGTSPGPAARPRGLSTLRPDGPPAAIGLRLAESCRPGTAGGAVSARLARARARPIRRPVRVRPGAYGPPAARRRRRPTPPWSGPANPVPGRVAEWQTRRP